MSDTDGDHDVKKPKGVYSTLIADGYWLYLKAEYKKAIDSFSTVSEVASDMLMFSINLWSSSC